MRAIDATRRAWWRGRGGPQGPPRHSSPQRAALTTTAIDNAPPAYPTSDDHNHETIHLCRPDRPGAGRWDGPRVGTAPVRRPGAADHPRPSPVVERGPRQEGDPG